MTETTKKDAIEFGDNVIAFWLYNTIRGDLEEGKTTKFSEASQVIISAILGARLEESGIIKDIEEHNHKLKMEVSK